MTKRPAGTRQHRERPSARGALGPPPASPASDPLVALTADIRASTKRALKIMAAETGLKERRIVDRALRADLGLEP
jgi:hypothetical protein